MFEWCVWFAIFRVTPSYFGLDIEWTKHQLRNNLDTMRYITTCFKEYV